MRYLIKAQKTEGLREVVARGQYGLKMINFYTLDFPGGGSISIDTKDDELAAVILSGSCSIKGSDNIDWENIGKRKNVFEGRATSFYLPIGAKCELVSKPGFSMAFVRVPAEKKYEPVLVRPEDVRITTAGAFNWKREVQKIFDDNLETNHILGGETLNPVSNWSSAPPHRHDEDNIPIESDMEEVYFFKLWPRCGFGMQRIYTYDKKVDEAHTLNDGDTTAIPVGYHPVVAGPGYQIYYLWFLAGKKRILCQNDDPDHAWVKKLGDKMAPQEAEIMKGSDDPDHPLLAPYRHVIEESSKGATQ